MQYGKNARFPVNHGSMAVKSQDLEAAEVEHGSIIPNWPVLERKNPLMAGTPEERG